MMWKRITSSTEHKLFRQYIKHWWMFFAKSEKETKQITRNRRRCRGSAFVERYWDRYVVKMDFMRWVSYCLQLTRIWSMLWCKFYWVLNAECWRYSINFNMVVCIVFFFCFSCFILPSFHYYYMHGRVQAVRKLRSSIVMVLKLNSLWKRDSSLLPYIFIQIA